MVLLIPFITFRLSFFLNFVAIDNELSVDLSSEKITSNFLKSWFTREFRHRAINFSLL